MQGRPLGRPLHGKPCPRRRQGKPIYKNVLGKPQDEVKEKLKTIIEDTKGLDIVKAGEYTVGQWMEVWFENYATIKVRPSSHQTYRGYLDHHIKPNIGKIPLSKLTTLDLQRLYGRLLGHGRVERVEAKHQPKGLSPKTVRNIRQIISSALKLARDQQLIANNPAEGCALPRLEREEMKTSTKEQLAAFFREAKETGVLEMYYVELATGLRRGKLLSLKWEDVDLEQGSLRVRRQVARINSEIVEAPLKTKNSYRTLPLAEGTVAVLKEQRKKARESPWVFPSPTGGPMSPDSVLHMLHRVLDRAKLPHIRFHDLRHSNATLLIAEGVDIRTVSNRLGHAQSSTTLNIYSHALQSRDTAAADCLDAALGDGTVIPFPTKASGM